MKYVCLGFLLLGFAFASAATAQDESDAHRSSPRFQGAAPRVAAPSRPAAAHPRASQAAQGQQPGMRIPQRRTFNPHQGIGRRGASMNADVSAPSQIRPRVFNTPAVDPRVFTPGAATNTAVAVDPTSRRTRFEPRAGQLNGAGARNWRTRDGQNRDSETVDLQNRTRDGVDGGVQNNTSATGGHDSERHSGHRRGNWRERHREWHERHEGDPDFADKHRRYHRQHYNRDWWRRNYSRFVLFGGGYYYWNRGYWYPAYGYDPYYSTYAYDAPLYSYHGLSPAQVVGRVQAALQRRGYYRGAVDGTFGPATRQALMNYQADVGLPMTGEIDEETLNSLEFE